MPKILERNTLNIGSHSFIRDHVLTNRLVVQSKKIDWGQWNINDIQTVEIKPTLLLLGDAEAWQTQRPYQVFLNGRIHFASDSWHKALDGATYTINRVWEKIGGSNKIDLLKQFEKNEPKITFGKIQSILQKAGVQLG